MYAHTLLASPRPQIFCEPQSDFADRQFVVITFLRAYEESCYRAADVP